MKMEADSLKLKTTQATDAGGLTFGPAWLRQLSSGDTNKNALPPSPGLAFQLSKHRYSREEMLAIYETIEKSLMHKSPPNLAEEFEELHRKDLQRPVLLTPPSLEEQKFLSTCVNSQVVLNMYNKIQGGQPGSQTTNSSNGGVSGSRHGDGRGESRGGSSSMRGGSRGGGRGGGISSERGRGRGTGGRGGMRAGHEPQFKTIDEESSQVSGRGGSRGGSAYKGSYSRAGWDEREQGGRGEINVNGGGEKRYSKAMAEDNWRNRAAPAEDSDESEASKNVADKEEAKGDNETDSNNTPSSNWRNTSEKKSSSNHQQSETTSQSSQREWPSGKQTSSSNTYDNRNRETYSKPKDSQPEWLDDDGEDNSMTFDTSGKFISVKELGEKKLPVEGENKKEARDQSKEKETMPSNEADEKLNKVDETSNKKGEKQDKSQTESSSSVDSNNTQNKVQENNETDANILKNTQEQQKIIELSAQQQQQGQPSFESLQAIHHNLQQQLKLKNDLLLASLNVDPRRGAVPSDHQDADRWFYLDPQNQIQGSFSSEQMAGWFAAGYFRLDLMIKRGRDEKFTPLGVVSNNWGRIPFTSGPTPPTQPQPQPQKPIISQQQQSSQPTKEQIIQQMQLFQRFQQMQLMPQNINILRNELTGHNSANTMANLGMVMQQIQQLQLQQNAALAATVSLGPATVSKIIQDIQSQQEALISQFALNNPATSSSSTASAKSSNSINNNPNYKQQQHHSSLPDLDPAILGAAPSKTQSIWGDMASGSRHSPITTSSLNPTPPPINKSLSPNNNGQSNSSSSSSLNQLGQFVHNNLDTNIIAQQIREFQASNGNNNMGGNSRSTSSMINLMMSDNNIKDKIQRLFEQTKLDEEKRRKQEELQMQLKREEEEKRRLAMEEKLAKEAELKRQQEEDRIREEQRKEQQRKKLQEIIIKQEEEKKRSDELKKKREEENKQKQKEEKLRAEQKKELKKLELAEAERKCQEEEKRRQEQETRNMHEQMRKQQEYERLKQKQQQEKLNNLQLPAHANWANQQQQQQMNQQHQQQQLKSILEQQALESMQQRLLEQQKQAELMQMQQSNQSSWSRLFRGNSSSQADSSVGSVTSPPAKESKEAATAAPISMATIQAEQIKKESVAKSSPATMSSKIQQQSASQVVGKQQGKVGHQQAPLTPWGNNNAASPAWSSNNGGGSNAGKHPSSNENNNNTSHSHANTNGNSGGFWTDISDKKSSKHANNRSNKNQFPDLPTNANQHEKQHTKHAKKIAAIEESVQQIFLRNMTISDEFMKWCHEQLKDFHVELHIPTFVNFLREIESCNEIEDYVVNYLGESQHAKDFAHQFYINRESQIKQQNNLTDDQIEESTYSKESQFSKKQKKRSKGQRVDHQLLGFTVQPDPNLKNRGDIDPL